MHGFKQLLVLLNLYKLSTGYLLHFLVVFVVMETTRHLLAIGQLSKSSWPRAFVSEKFNFLSWAAEKDAGGGILKSTQDRFTPSDHNVEQTPAA